jgi:hypothetical protein
MFIIYIGFDVDKKYCERTVIFFNIANLPHYVSIFRQCGRNVSTESGMIEVSDILVDPKWTLAARTKRMETGISFHQIIWLFIETVLTHP